MKLRDVFRQNNKGCCNEMIVKIGVHIIKDMFYLFELGGVDVILGIAWLATLEDVKVNWKTLTMTYHCHGQAIQI